MTHNPSHALQPAYSRIRTDVGGRPRTQGRDPMTIPELTWHKSSFSQANGCVEVAYDPTRTDGRTIGVRHSLTPHAPRLWFTPAEWGCFEAGVTAGEFTIPALTGEAT